MNRLKDHLEKLEYFFAVAQESSFRRAAQKLNLSQPSITRAVLILEGVIGEALFFRKVQKIALTPHGKILLEYCHKLFASLNEVEQKLGAPSDPFAGVIRIGTYDSIAIYFWPDFIKSFAIKYPSLMLELTTGRSAALAQDLLAGQVDFTLAIEPHLHSHFEIIELYKDTFDFYHSPQLKIKNTKNLPLILMGDALSTNGEHLEESLLKSEILFEKKFVVSSLETAKEFAKNGLGIAVLPTQVAKTHVKSRILKKCPVRIKERLGEHRVCVTLAKERLHLPTYQLLISELQSFVKAWLER